MLIQEVMTQAPEMIAPDATVEHAARRMGELDVGFIPIAEGDSLIGVVTDRDIAIRAVADGRDPKQTTVKDIMSQDMVSISQDQSLEDAANLFKQHRVRRLLVRDDQQRLIGVLSLGDVAVATGNHELYGDALEKVSQPAQPQR